MICSQIFLLSLLLLQVTSEPITPKLYKCLYNELGLSRKLHLPNTIMGDDKNATFQLDLKCATRLPHCLKQCTTEILRKTIQYPDQRPDLFNVHFTPSGFLRYGSDYFPQEEYCIFRSSQSFVMVEMCRPSCGKTHACIPKCCAADKVFDYNDNRCVYSNSSWEPSVYQTQDLQICGEKRKDIRLHYYQPSLAHCSAQRFLLKSVEGESEHFRVKFRLLLNGRVLVRELQVKEWKRPKPGQYCLDGVQNFGTNLGPYNGDPLDQILIICVDESDQNFLGKNENGENENETILETRTQKMALTGILYSILLFSGTPFLFVTVVVYILLWGKQNIHGMTLFSHSLAILLNYLGQGITNTISRLYDSHDNASTSCALIGIANHYFALASFCWMTMINYDLWSMFRHLKNTVGRSKGMKRFMAYMLIGWGVPFIAVLISVILDMKYGLYGEDGGDCTRDYIVPLYGHKSCYVTEESRLYFLFYPIGTLMAINIILAGLTTYNMYVHNKGAKIAEKKSTKHKRMFEVWSKLFVVMGVALTSEVIVWNLKKKNETLPWYLIFPDVLSVLQAIAIFLLFACQPKIIKQLHEGYPQLRPFLDKLLQLPCYTNNRAPGSVPLPVKL